MGNKVGVEQGGAIHKNTDVQPKLEKAAIRGLCLRS
jgi:hypothetical protein